MKPLRIACIGAGQRSRIYLELLSEQPDLFMIVAAADPVKEYREFIRVISNNPDFQSFDSADSLLASPKIADILMIGTQDNYHYEPCLKALELGYDIVLEKPVAPTWREVCSLEAKARELGRRVTVCHVLRYAPTFTKIKSLLDEGVIGKLVNMNSCEGVEPWHFAHSFVRGHWSESATSNPIMMAKCCHDLDLISWFMGEDFTAINSFGQLTHFKPKPVSSGESRLCPIRVNLSIVCLQP